MTILHFADIHFGMENYGRLDPKTGLHSRLTDWQKSYQAVVDYAVGKNETVKPVDLVIFAGDAFKTRDPSPTYVRAFAQGIRQMAAAGVPVVMAVGNHDLPNAAGKANTLDIFSTLAVPGVYVSREPEYLKIKLKSGFVQVVTLPWMYKSQLFKKEDMAKRTGEEINKLFQEKIIGLFKLALSKVEEGAPAVGIVHATVEGAAFGSERSVLLGSDIVVPLKLLADKRLNYVALGHIHHHQVLDEDPPVVYSGSIERIDFGEEKEPKGFVVATLSRQTKLKFVTVAAREFKTINVEIKPDDPDPTQTVLAKIHLAKVKDAVVRVVVRCTESRALEVREMPLREALEGAHFIAGIIKQVERGQRLSEEKGYSDELLAATPLDALEEFWKKRDIPHTRAAKLRDLAKELIEETELT